MYCIYNPPKFLLPKEEREDGEDLVDLPRGHSQQELPDDA
jgi:hypothetical protein